MVAERGVERRERGRERERREKEERVEKREGLNNSGNNVMDNTAIVNFVEKCLNLNFWTLSGSGSLSYCNQELICFAIFTKSTKKHQKNYN